VRPSSVRLLYLGDGTSLTCRPSQQNTRFVEMKVGAVWQSIQRLNATDSFKPNPGKLCDWCAFQAWCPSFGGNPDEARALGETLRVERRAAKEAAGTIADLDQPLPFADTGS
jgi:putative RecB family exonuclease